jgi:CubicO group peptidase (beta-lactamase class C family)
MRIESALVVGALLAAGVFQAPKVDPRPPVAPTKETPPGTAAVMTAADVEAFVDGLVPLQIEREDIGGMVIAVVKDGAPLFAKGYGYADVAKKAPVTPDTLFRPGSISKLFTWTAVMQLVEQGKLDLDRDVNQYIDFNIPARFGKPLTLRHVMTHTPGFEEAIKDLFVPAVSDVPPLRDYLLAHLPTQIYPPGTMPAYSNYATALAGYIVQRASGKPFDDYVEEFIFKPLGMMHTSFRQPLPDSMQPLMSKGYLRASQGAKDYEYVAAFPAGSSAVSANDIMRFMLAHLQDGEYEGARILKPETARLMHSRQFGMHPDMNGMALGFYEESRNGHRIIGHGGDTIYFHSDLHLIADQRVGVYLSYNSVGKGETNPRGALWQKFLDRYFPYTPPAPPAPSSANDDARAAAGYYVASRRVETGFLAFMNGLQQARVYVNDDGTISSTFARGLNGEPLRFRAVAPMVFQDVDGQERLVFTRDGEGPLTIVLPFPAIVLQRTSGIRGAMFNMVLVGFSLSVIVLTLVLWPVGGLARWHYRKPFEITPAHRRLRRLVRLVCLFDVAAVMVIAYLATKAATPGAFSTHLDPSMRVFQLFAFLGAIGSIAAVIHASRTLRSNAWWWTKVHECALAIACVAFAWFLVYWHMLTPGLRY